MSHDEIRVFFRKNATLFVRISDGEKWWLPKVHVLEVDGVMEWDYSPHFLVRLVDGKKIVYDLTLEEVSTLRKGANYLKAQAKHVATGARYVSDEVLSERYEICTQCSIFKFTGRVSDNDHRIVGECTHTSCGCNIRPDRKTPNKLLHSAQECPDGKWKKEGVQAS